MTGDEQWRRFERAATGRSGGTKFWMIRVEGSRCLLRHGLVGQDDGEAPRLLEFSSGAEARTQHKKRVRTKLRAGWVEVELGGPSATDAQGAELEAQLRDAIGQDPGDLDAWAVYADLLSMRAPLLGERVALGLARVRSSDRRARKRIEGRIQQLESARARDLLGPTLAGIIGERRFEGVIELERRMGMIVGAEVHDRPGFDWRFEAVVGSLLELDAAAILRELGIYGSSEREAFEGALAHVLASPRPTLTRLRLDYGQVEGSREWRRSNFRARFDLPSAARISAGLARLERLELVGPFDLGRWRHPRLRELIVRRVGVLDRVSLAGCDLPALERLQIADRHGPQDWSAAELPALRELLINCGGQLGPPLRSLLEAPLVAQLETLAIVAASLHESVVELLLDHAARLDRLERLILVNPPLRPGLLGPLQRRFPTCEVLRQGAPLRSRSARLLVEYTFDGRRVRPPSPG